MKLFHIENDGQFTYITLSDSQQITVLVTSMQKWETVQDFLSHMKEHFSSNKREDPDFSFMAALIEAAEDNNLWDLDELLSAYEGCFEDYEDYVRESADCPSNLGDAVFYVDWEQWGKDLLDDKYVATNYKTWDLYVFDL